MTERKPLLIPYSSFWFVRRMLPFTGQLESSGESEDTLEAVRDQLTSGGVVVVDAHILRPECRRRQITDIFFTAEQLFDRTQVDSMLIPAAGNFFHHPLIHPWIRSHRNDHGQVLQIAPVYSSKRDSIGATYSSIGHDPVTMEKRNTDFHSRATNLLNTPRSIVLLSPYAGTQALGEAEDIPRRVHELLINFSDRLYASLSWLTPSRTFITAFQRVDPINVLSDRQDTTQSLNQVFTNLFDLTQYDYSSHALTTSPPKQVSTPESPFRLS